MPVKLGDKIRFPQHDGATKVTLTWSQGNSNRTAEYWLILAKNDTQPGVEIMVFLAQEFYNEDKLKTIANAQGDYWELQVDGQFQYGQKNKAGDNRFLVLHDKARKPYQHRFIDTAVQIKALGFANEVARLAGYGALADLVSNHLKSAFGDFLRDFTMTVLIVDPPNASLGTRTPTQLPVVLSDLAFSDPQHGNSESDQVIPLSGERTEAPSVAPFITSTSPVSERTEAGGLPKVNEFPPLAYPKDTTQTTEGVEPGSLSSNLADVLPRSITPSSSDPPNDDSKPTASATERPNLSEEVSSPTQAMGTAAQPTDNPQLPAPPAPFQPEEHTLHPSDITKRRLTHRRSSTVPDARPPRLSHEQNLRVTHPLLSLPMLVDLQDALSGDLPLLSPTMGNPRNPPRAMTYPPRPLVKTTHGTSPLNPSHGDDGAPSSTETVKPAVASESSGRVPNEPAPSQSADILSAVSTDQGSLTSIASTAAKPDGSDARRDPEPKTDNERSGQVNPTSTRSKGYRGEFSLTDEDVGSPSTSKSKHAEMLSGYVGGTDESEL